MMNNVVLALLYDSNVVLTLVYDEQCCINFSFMMNNVVLTSSL